MLKKESIKYRSFGQLAEADYPHGNLQDDITITLRYSIERVVFLSDDLHIWLTPPPHILGSVDNVGIILDLDEQQSFTEFQKGDTIFIRTGPYEGNAVITEKIDNNTIRVSVTLPSHEVYFTDEFIACVTAPSSLRYRYNFIESDGAIDYKNHIDGQEMLMEANGLSSAVGATLILSQNGSKSHQIGSASVKCVSVVGSYKFIYEITHNTKLLPILKDSYLQSLSNGNVLDDWAGDKQYDYAYNIELLASQDNEIDKISIEGVEEGNTGSYNEHFNTNSTGFYVESKTFMVDGVQVNAIDFNKITNVTLVYKSNAQFFSTLRTEVTLLAAHDDFDNYLDTNQLYLDNFCFGRAGTSGIINMGSDYRVFTSYSQTIVDPSTLEVKFNVSLGAKTKENISKSNPKKYALFISSEANGLSVPAQVRSRDLVHISEFVETLPQSEMITTSSQFWLDPATLNEGYVALLPETFMTDDILAVSKFSYPKNTPIKLVSIKNEIIAGGSTDVVLDSTTSSVVSAPLDPNNVQIVDINTIRPLNQSYKSNLLISRGVDTATDWVFEIAFPFIVGYRDDKAITNQAIPSEVYDYGTVGNGLSSDWYRYVSAGMSIKYRVTYIFEYNSMRYSQTYEKPVNVNDYSNPEWTTKSIRLYDSLGAELIDGSTKIIKGDVTIEASFSKAILPPITDVQCYFFVAKANEDGYRTSSTYDNSFKKIIFGSLSIVSGSIVATGQLNAEDFKSDVRIWARLFEKQGDPIPPCILIAEDGTYLVHEQGGWLIPETCGELDTDQIFDSQMNYLKDSMGNRLKAL